ncbi:MAG: hypothetical protein V1792_01225 [Pseudomonadota bacterium]
MARPFAPSRPHDFATVAATKWSVQALIDKVLKTVDSPQIGTVTNRIEYEVMERSECACPSCDCPEGLPSIPIPDFSILEGWDFLLDGSELPSSWPQTSEDTGAGGIPYSSDHDLGEFHSSLGNSSFGETIIGALKGGWQLSDSDGGSSGTENITESGGWNPAATGEYPGTPSGDDGNRYLPRGDSEGTGGLTGLSGETTGGTTITSGGSQGDFRQTLLENLAGANIAFAAAVAALGFLVACWPYVVRAIQFLRQAFSLVNRIRFLQRWADKLRNMTKRDWIKVIRWFFIFVLTGLLTCLDYIINTLEGWERSMSWKYDWDDCRMKLVRGTRYALEDLRRWLQRLKKQVEDGWRDRAPYNPEYHP